MKDHESLREAANTLMLPRGAEAILPSLVPGEALFRGPIWADAVLAKIHSNLLPPVPQTIQYDKLPYTPSRKLHEMPHVLDALEAKKTANKTAKLNTGRPKKTELAQKSYDFLSRACENLAVPTAPIFKAMGKISFKTQIAIRKDLEGRQLISFETWRIGSSDRLLQEVNPKGYEKANKKPLKLEGGGKLPHRCAMLWIKDFGIRQGYQHSISEYLIAGTRHKSDCAWFNDKFRNLHVFEIVHTSWNNLPQSIKTTFESDMPIENLTVITAQKAISKKIEMIICADTTLSPYLDRVTFEVITPYMEAFVKGRSNGNT
jgi:hypothetical protein